jgi:signal transduction histidine kinase
MNKTYSNLTKEELIEKLIYFENQLLKNKQTEDTFISSFELIFDYFPYPVVYLNLDCNILYFNSLFFDYSNLFYKISPKKGISFKDLNNNNQDLSTNEILEKALSGQVVNLIEATKNNEKTYYFQKLCIPQINIQGTVNGVLIFLIDINESEIYKKLINEKIDVVEKLLNSLNCIVLTIDWNSKQLLYYNEYLNLINGNVEIKNYEDVFENDDLNILNYEQEQVKYMSFDVNSNKFYSKEIFLSKFNRWFLVIYKPFEWLDGNLALNLLLFDINKYQEQNDNNSKLINELKKQLDFQTHAYQKIKEDLNRKIKEKEDAETELRLAKEQLTLNLKRERELSKLKSHILDNISHEINTPLTIITSSIYLIKMYLKNGNIQEVDKHLDQIDKSANYLANFTKATQDIYRTKFGINPVSLSIQNIISNIEEVLQSFTNSITGKRVINRFYQSNIILYETDFNLFKQIIQQFISNAIKYTQENGIISIKVTEEEEKITISVIDNGIGINKEDQDLIFDLFYRSKDTIGLFEGSGVGLAIAKSNAETIGANIEFSSSPNIGSEFHLILTK